MKTSPIISMLLLCLFLGQQGFSQHLCEAQSTTPSWDWRGSEPYTFYLYGARYGNTGGVVKKESPWFDLHNENVSTFRYENPKNYEPNNGWILIQRDFGAPGRFINHPYFILYNRYAGILRVFVAISETVAGYNKAVIKLRYAEGTRRTAILGFHSGDSYISPTKEFNNNVPEIMVGNTYAYDLPYWLHADFVMNYDPCTCEVNGPALQFSVELVSESTLEFEAEGESVPKDVIGRESDGKMAFSSFAKKSKSVTDTYKKSSSGIKKLMKVKKIANPKPWNLLNFVPGLGSVIGAVDAFVGLFSDKKTETMPVAYKLNFKAEGKIVTPEPQRAITMDVPNANVNLIPSTPIKWRNTLGVFTLLETPTFTYTDGQGSVNVCPPEFSYNSNCYIKNKNLTLNKDLKFAINSASYPSRRNYNIKVSLEVDDEYGQQKKGPLVTYSCSSSKPVTLSGVEFDNLTGNVYLKVVVTFNKTLGGNLNEAIFVARYRARPGAKSGTCTPYTRYASDVATVCNSTAYKNKTTQYLRTDTRDDDEKILVKEGGYKNSFSMFPNPSRGIVDFEYTLATHDYVSISVLDLSGREIVQVVNNYFYPAGTYRTQIDLLKERKIAPGVYLCRMQSSTGEKTQRLILQ